MRREDTLDNGSCLTVDELENSRKTPSHSGLEGLSKLRILDLYVYIPSFIIYLTLNLKRSGIYE